MYELAPSRGLRLLGKGVLQLLRSRHKLLPCTLWHGQDELAASAVHSTPELRAWRPRAHHSVQAFPFESTGGHAPLLPTQASRHAVQRPGSLSSGLSRHLENPSPHESPSSGPLPTTTIGRGKSGSWSWIVGPRGEMFGVARAGGIGGEIRGPPAAPANRHALSTPAAAPAPATTPTTAAPPHASGPHFITQQSQVLLQAQA